MLKIPVEESPCPLRGAQFAVRPMCFVNDSPGNVTVAALQGGTDPAAKPLKAFGGASVLEIIDSYDTATYRTVYTTRFRDTLYVLHVFQKKSTKGIATTQQDIELIKRRMAAAKKHFEEGRGQ